MSRVGIGDSEQSRDGVYLAERGMRKPPPLDPSPWVLRLGLNGMLILRDLLARALPPCNSM